jgi:hypothetical protein
LVRVGDLVLAIVGYFLARRANLKEAKRVVFTFHQQMAKAPAGNAENATITAPPSDGRGAENIIKIRD